MEYLLRNFILKMRGGETNKKDVQKVFLGFILISIILVILLKITTPYMAIATLSFIFLTSGVLLHHKKELHIPLMLSGVFVDLTLVLVLEIKRSAVATALGDSLNLFQRGHIIFSTCAVLLYLPTVYLGAKYALKHQRNSGKKHLYFGRVAYVFRAIGFVLMFSLLKHVS